MHYKLLKQKILIKENYNNKGYDHTSWYAFKDENTFTKTVKSIIPNGKIDYTKQSKGFNQTVKPIPIPIPDKLKDKLTNPNPLKKSSEILELDLKIAQEKKFLIFQLESIFHPNERERRTFARVISHLVNKCQKGEMHIAIFKDAIEWAKQAKASNAVNKKGLFIAKIKEETGFRKQDRLLKSGVI